MGMHVINIICPQLYSLSYLTSHSVNLTVMYYLQFDSPVEYRVVEQSNRAYIQYWKGYWSQSSLLLPSTTFSHCSYTTLTQRRVTFDWGMSIVKVLNASRAEELIKKKKTFQICTLAHGSLGDKAISIEIEWVKERGGGRKNRQREKEKGERKRNFICQ